MFGTIFEKKKKSTQSTSMCVNMRSMDWCGKHRPREEHKAKLGYKTGTLLKIFDFSTCTTAYETKTIKDAIKLLREVSQRWGLSWDRVLILSDAAIKSVKWNNELTVVASQNSSRSSLHSVSSATRATYPLIARVVFLSMLVTSLLPGSSSRCRGCFGVVFAWVAARYVWDRKETEVFVKSTYAHRNDDSSRDTHAAGSSVHRDFLRNAISLIWFARGDWLISKLSTSKLLNSDCLRWSFVAITFNNFDVKGIEYNGDMRTKLRELAGCLYFLLQW